ncbi:ribonuclease D [Anaerolineales bacterium]
MTLSMQKAIHIDSDSDFKSFVKTLKKHPQIAVDTESNSLHSYNVCICLIQISTREQDYIIDPLSISDLSAFGEILEDRRIEKIFHAAEYDLISFKRDYDFVVHNIFDTMLAAQVCGYDKVGLDKILAQHFEVKVDKTHQKDDWGQRPLPADSLLYAQMDTHYLHRVRDIFQEQLLNLGRWEEAQEIFYFSENVGDVPTQHFDPEGFWNLGNPFSLNAREMAILRELFFLRESIAAEKDKPVFRVIKNNEMIDIVRQRPHTLGALESIAYFKKWLIRDYGELILAAVERGEQAEVPKAPAPQVIDPVLIDRYTVLQQWRKRVAIKRGVEANVILPKQALWQIASRLPQQIDDFKGINGMGEWRINTYANQIIDLVRGFIS